MTNIAHTMSVIDHTGTRARIPTTDGDRTRPVIMTGTSTHTRRTMPAYGHTTPHTGAPTHASGNPTR